MSRKNVCFYKRFPCGASTLAGSMAGNLRTLNFEYGLCATRLSTDSQQKLPWMADGRDFFTYTASNKTFRLNVRGVKAWYTSKLQRVWVVLSTASLYINGLFRLYPLLCNLLSQLCVSDGGWQQIQCSPSSTWWATVVVIQCPLYVLWY